MKPTEKQMAICNAIITHIYWWRDTNDIDSPTHYTDMEDCLRADLDNVVNDGDRYIIQQKLKQIFEVIKRNK